jgi:hypothetical protein
MAAGDEDSKTREKLMQSAQDCERMAQAREGAEVNNVTPLNAGTANRKVRLAHFEQCAAPSTSVA